MAINWYWWQGKGDPSWLANNDSVDPFPWITYIDPPSGAIGTAAITEGGDVVAAVGTDSVSGTAAIVEGADVVAGVGTDSVSGTAAIAEGADVVAGVGTDSVSGTAAIVEGADVVAATGTDSTSGIAAIVEGADVVAAVGTDSVTGTAAIVEGVDTVAAVGTVSGGSGPIPDPFAKWTPFKMACRYRALQQGALNVGNTRQNVANLLALARAQADSPSNPPWARWRTAVNSPHITSNLMINVPRVPGFVPIGGYFGRMWDWIVKYLKGVA